MSKREKIIVVLALVGVLYAAYTFLFTAPPKPPFGGGGAKLEETNRFANEMLQNIQKEGETTAEDYLLKRLSTEWPSDPMIASATQLKAERITKVEEPVRFDVNLVYSGFLALGNTNLAIINGLEYGVGDELEMGGYIVERIDPKKTVIRLKGTRRRVAIPLQEVDSASNAKTS